MEEINFNPKIMFVGTRFADWHDYRPMIVLGKFRSYYVATEIIHQPILEKNTMTLTYYSQAIELFDHPIEINSRRWAYKGHFIIKNKDKRLKKYTVKKDNPEKDIVFEDDSWFWVMDYCDKNPFHDFKHKLEEFIKN